MRGRVGPGAVLLALTWLTGIWLVWNALHPLSDGPDVSGQGPKFDSQASWAAAVVFLGTAAWVSVVWWRRVRRRSRAERGSLFS